MPNNNQSEPEAARAVLWDMDGTLLDSTEYHWISWRDTLARENYQFSREQFDESFGKRNDAILRGLFGPQISKTETDRIAFAKEEAYRELVRARGIELLPGVESWLKSLKADGWRQAIASSAPMANIETILAVLSLEGVFDARVSAETVEHGKPDPQVFLKAAATVNVPPERSIVVEDAPAGVEAARRGGMRSIGVLTGAHTQLDADLVVPTLAELPPGAFDRLLAETRPG